MRESGRKRLTGGQHRGAGVEAYSDHRTLKTTRKPLPPLSRRILALLTPKWVEEWSKLLRVMPPEGT
jgi:hypothetical protein